MDNNYFYDIISETINLPLIALRGICIFPGMSVSFDVERKRSVSALHAAIKGDRRIFLAAQKEVLKEYPDKDDIYTCGVVAVLRQFIKTQDGGMRVMIDGLYRAAAQNFDLSGEHAVAEVSLIMEPVILPTPEIEAVIRNTIGLYERYLGLTGNAVPEALIGLSVKNDPGYTADFIAQNVYFKYPQKQEFLEIIDPVERLNEVCSMLQREVEVLVIEKDLNEKLRENLMHNQRENILREQMRIIQSELGDDDMSEIENYRSKILALGLSEEIEDKLFKETDRLAKQPYTSAEASVIRSYLDAVLALPWNTSTRERLDIEAARKILDRDHFGLDKVKERILEFLAVRKMVPDIKGGIICLVGPPGVGKTSIAISIADAMNRKLARMSLGGVHDEADIRGHRKTYIGAMPGRIMSAITQSKSKNPLLLLDEIDKLGGDHRGDPASALLEALDPEQNSSFRDHYLEIPFDLSEVMFITTANTTDTIPRPLLDRMEVIHISSYTDEEKLSIARNYLLPKQRKKHGLDGRKLRVSDDVIRDIISGYTRESGVRKLERELAALCRKADMKIAAGEIKSLTVTSDKLENLLGPRRYKPEHLNGKEIVGVVNGLAWTSVGGEILEVEVTALDGNGKLELTGNLGNVMKESAQAAISYIRSRCDVLGIDREFYKNKDIHIHLPEGAVPKDGPSAGITMAVAVISALTGAPVRRDVAMTGEITLTGRILPIGGLKEKTMAAYRYGVKTVIIPADNESDLSEIDQSVRRALNFITASKLDDILDVVLVLPETAKENVENKAYVPRKDKKGTTAQIRQ